MKTYKLTSLFIVILMVAALQSCDSFLDVEPQQSVSDQTVYASHDGVQNALYGAYERVAGPQLFAGSSIFHSDLLANETDMSWIGTFIGYREMNWKTLSTTDGTITNKWIRAYHAIDLVNNVLANLDVVRDTEKDRIEGEALFIRGIMYYELIRFFALPYVKGQPNTGDGVPLVTTPTTGINDSSYPARATISAVYQQILSDLNTAKTKLSDLGKSAGSNGGRATSSTAAAFLARVHLAMEEWSLAAQEADYVISNFGGYGSLNATPREAFNNDGYTSEDVFMIRQNASSHAGQANDGIATFFASLPGMGRGDVNVTAAHLSRYEEGDLRGGVTDNPDIVTIADVPEMFYIGVGTNSGNVMSSKWGKYDAYIPVVRLAEMILTRAEANFRAGSTVGATPLADVNAIRARANVPAWDQLTLDQIYAERKRELAFEGHMLSDLRRFRGSTVAPSGSTHAGQVLQWNDDRLVLPIPQREMDVNPNLIQNGAY